MRLTIFHEILHTKQFKGAEFIDDNRFLWSLTLVSVATCHLLLDHSFGRRTANGSILMKLCILHKWKALSSMVTIVFCSFWRPSVKFDTCQFWHRWFIELKILEELWEVHVQFNNYSRLHSFRKIKLTLSWRRPISYRNQSNQWNGFYMISASVIKGLNAFQSGEKL